MTAMAVLLFLLLAGVIPHDDSKRIVFSAANRVAREIFAPIDDFRRYFSSPDIPVRLVQQNPGVRSLECIHGVSGSSYRARLQPIEFPWTKITSTIDYDVDFAKGRFLSVDCHEGGYRHEFEGPMAGILSGLELSVTGHGNFTLMEDNNTIVAEADIQVAFPVPSIIPDPVIRAIERTGSQVIENQMEGDLGDILDRIIRSSRDVFPDSENKDIPSEI
jgi:hypothetical protein